MDLRDRFAFALPFVTRSLRGPRRRRIALLGAIFAALSIVASMWLTLGSGSLEQGFREEVGLERSQWERERLEYIVITHDPFEFERLDQERAWLVTQPAAFDSPDPEVYSDEYSRLRGTMSEAFTLLDQASRSEPRNGAEAGLQAAASELLGRTPYPEVWINPDDVDYYGFHWDNADERERLVSILDAKGVPKVSLYASPLGMSDALKLLGFIAGGALSLMFLVFGPLLVGIQQAQEVHENTLMPMTGTALGPRELALGLAAGPLAVIGILAAPQVGLLGITAAISGNAGWALAFVVALLATGALMTALAQLAGHVAGKRRTPGMVGIALLMFLGAAWFVGLVFAIELDNDTASLLSLAPHGGVLVLLGETFVSREAEIGLLADAYQSIAAATAGTALLAYLATQALSSRISGRFGPTLGPWSARVGALACLFLALMAAPQPDMSWNPGEGDVVFFFVSLGLLVLPFALFVIARVPIGDFPAKLRTISLPRLLGELGLFALAHFIACLALTTDLRGFGLFNPIALGYLLWCYLVLGLIAIRMVAIPNRIASSLWIGFCAVALVVAFIHAVAWSSENLHGVEDVFALSHLSPFLGFIQAALLAWIPISLVRGMGKELGGLRGTGSTTTGGLR
jgi:hypothetical protein